MKVVGDVIFLCQEEVQRFRSSLLNLDNYQMIRLDLSEDEASLTQQYYLRLLGPGLFYHYSGGLVLRSLISANIPAEQGRTDVSQDPVITVKNLLARCKVQCTEELCPPKLCTHRWKCEFGSLVASTTRVTSGQANVGECELGDGQHMACCLQ